MANNQQQQQHQIISHLNNDIYNNGLKFERDRTFRNKLIMKAIIIMAVLLVSAVVLCATMARSAGNGVVYNQTKTVRFYSKVPISYDSDVEETTKEREILNELKTAFVPAPVVYQKPTEVEDTVDIKERIRRQTELLFNLPMKRAENSSGKDSIVKNIDPNEHSKNFDVIWLTGSDVFRRGDGNITEESTKSGEEKQVVEESSQEKVQTREKNKFHDRYEDVSRFWRGEMDEQTVRSIQAKKMLSYMDPNADPCDDFYQYACGNWEKTNPIPEDKAGFDTFEMLRESLGAVLRDLLLEPSGNDTSASEQKAKDFFESCMDEETLKKRGNEPLYVLINDLKGWPMVDRDWNESSFDWLELMAVLRLYNNDILMSQWVGPDIKSSAQYIIQFDQTSLGLPIREYYLQPSSAMYLEAYKAYIIEIAVLLGADKENATSEAEDVITFETKLARITSSKEDRRNVSEHYVKMSLYELSSLIPQIDWIRYLRIVLGRKVEPEENVVVFALKYFKDLVKLIDLTSPRTVVNYLMWRFMKHRVNNLGKEFQDARQNFRYVLFGMEKSPPRWSVCVDQVNANMGMALGSMYVKRYFDESSKNDTVSMTQDIMNSFREILNATDWINQDTKNLAQDKVTAMGLRIAYPDFILNDTELDEHYRKVNVSKHLYFENTLNLLRHLARVELNRLGTKVNKTEWNTPPAVVNAYYSRPKNQIMFPAGILQPPFYHKYFPRSLNYGGIGIVIGHEITHGFDDKGRYFDQYGNLDRWWDEGAVEKFHQKAKCLIDQYSGYTIRDVDIQIDGVQTQGENIADNGGIKQAFRAYERWLKRHNSTDETLPGLNATNFQLFFLNFAQVWCEGMRPKASRNKLKTSVHSPGKFRVIGTLSNSEEFAKAFNCSPNSTMNPRKKCQVW